MPRTSANVTASTFVRHHRTSCQPAQVVKLSRHGVLRANLAAAKTAASCPSKIVGIWHMTIAGHIWQDLAGDTALSYDRLSSMR